MERTIWIIGCCGGIGKEISTCLRSTYDNICLFDIVPSKFELSDKEFFLQVDFSQWLSVRETCQYAAELFGSPASMIVAAGQVLSLDFEHTDDESMESLFDNNYKVVFNSLRAFFFHCSRSKKIEKSIVVVSSNAGSASRPGQIVYASMKAAINSLVRSLAKDWGKYNIRINAIAPGTVIVPRNYDTLKNKYPTLPFDNSRPLGRIMTPANLVPSCFYLLESNNPITGQIITVDEGSSL